MNKFLAFFAPILVLAGIGYFYISSHPQTVKPTTILGDKTINQILPTPEQKTEFGTPEKLTISALGINAPVEAVGLDAKRNMDVPKKPEDVGWYKLGYKPGEAGNAVFAGHLDWTNGPAVFWELNKVKPGDQITVTDNSNRTLTFEVTNKQNYPWNQFPVQDVFGSQGDSKLILITCGGTFDKPSQNYSQRIVVYSILKST